MHNFTVGSADYVSYGAAGDKSAFRRAEIKAKKRVIYFLLVFIVIGFFRKSEKLNSYYTPFGLMIIIICVCADSVLCFELLIVNILDSSNDHVHHDTWKKLIFITLCLQVIIIVLLSSSVIPYMC